MRFATPSRVESVAHAFTPLPDCDIESAVVLAVVREAIAELLQRHSATPFRNILESDFVAELSMDLRGRLDADPLHSVRLNQVRADGRAAIYGSAPTSSLVHTEMKLTVGTWKSGPCDIVIFDAAAQTELRVELGLANAQRPLRADQAAVVIELKAVPSAHTGNLATFVKDVEKLRAIRTRASNVSAFFVLIDKAAHPTGCTSTVVPNTSWIASAGTRQPVLPGAIPPPLVECWALEHQGAAYVPGSFWL